MITHILWLEQKWNRLVQAREHRWRSITIFGMCWAATFIAIGQIFSKRLQNHSKITNEMKFNERTVTVIAVRKCRPSIILIFYCPPVFCGLLERSILCVAAWDVKDVFLSQLWNMTGPIMKTEFNLQRACVIYQHPCYYRPSSKQLVSPYSQKLYSLYNWTWLRRNDCR